MADSRLYKPLKIGNIEVKHRIGMPSLTRLRATESRVPSPLMKEYYSQRASVPGTLILAEGTFVSSTCGGFAYAPGIWNEAQVQAWRDITDEVHRKGCFIYCQLFSMGRAADPAIAAKEGMPIVAPSAIPMHEGAPMPQALSTEGVEQIVQDFVKAAENAIRAGFDGVEIHGANGYLIDQFIQDVSNQRDDKYGGSIENRTRFVKEIMESVAGAIGAEHVGLRLTPWGLFQGMRMEDPVPQFSNVIVEARKLNLAYLHLVEPRVSGAGDRPGNDDYTGEGLDFAYELWDGPLLVAGGYKPEEARNLLDVRYPMKDIVVMFGRYFISNPDLVYRIKEGLELAAYDRNTFYTCESPLGYSDYPFSKEFSAIKKEAVSA